MVDDFYYTYLPSARQSVMPILLNIHVIWLFFVYGAKRIHVTIEHISACDGEKETPEKVLYPYRLRGDTL